MTVDSEISRGVYKLKRTPKVMDEKNREGRTSYMAFSSGLFGIVALDVSSAKPVDDVSLTTLEVASKISGQQPQRSFVERHTEDMVAAYLNAGIVPPPMEVTRKHVFSKLGDFLLGKK
ncbi:MAG TPA: hypothetical protein VLE91_01695 [Candidatus Saccharimonadales bacterium]|nr:hypothetical protein [Candidatus Saccharimonadales bacterium]